MLHVQAAALMISVFVLAFANGPKVSSDGFFVHKNYRAAAPTKQTTMK